MYCENETKSWANINDLYDRYGEEFVNKLSIRRNFDSSIQEYVADESESSITRVQSLALCDAKDKILAILSQNFSNISLLDRKPFYAIKTWHIKFTIQMLKEGGDCKDCITEFTEFLKNGRICSDNLCLKRISTFISARKAIFKCEQVGKCE